MSMNLRKGQRSRLLLLGLLLACGVAGCSSASEVTPAKESKPLVEHEKEFDPGAFRETTKDTLETPPPPPPREQEIRVEWIERVEKTMGYRIQLFSTTSIDEAQSQVLRYQRRLDSMQVATGRLDMTFDAPYYKVRMGDFLQRPPADSLRKLLQERGVQEAWVVRDRVERKIRVKK